MSICLLFRKYHHDKVFRWEWQLSHEISGWWRLKAKKLQMQKSFVRIYLLVAGIVLAATALAKLPAIFHERNWCSDPDILTHFQPQHVSNEQLLGAAASVEGIIVLLICLSPWRWLPCVCAAGWAMICVVARLFLMDPYANCKCLGWLAKPGVNTNIAATLIALALAGGGWLAFRAAWESEKLVAEQRRQGAEQKR
ncbi:MAG: hypothetical protein P4L50_20320 [Anaerolineaceae bacterium]|nr:hypothetical protein [Anaerolineaceae bacterium]